MKFSVILLVMRFKLTLSAILFPLFLSGCGAPVKKVDYAPTPQISETAAPIPIKFSGIELLLPPGTNIGTQRSGVLCASPAYPVNRNVLQKNIDQKFLKQAFHDALEANGYDVVGSLNIVFDPEDEEQSAEYSIKATLKDAQIDMCASEEGALNILKPIPGEFGKMYLAIDWSVYDQLHRTVVYKTRTEGYTSRKIPNAEGMTLLFHDAFEMAAHNLAADAGFQNLIINGVKPPRAHDGIDQRGEKTDTRPRTFNEDEEVTFTNQAISRQPFAKTVDTGKNVAVTIEAGGHGSGFFITRQGHIITDANVVGQARRVRVMSAMRKTGLTAEVLRVNRGRNVALLKLEEIPEWLDITTLSVQLDWPNVGEDIYALGTPRDRKRLQGSLSKGIVSAHHRNFKYEGVRQNFFQGDIEVHAGHAGGPIMDEYGNIVGLSVFGFGEEGSAFGNGLNLFIPIREAFDALGIAY